MECYSLHCATSYIHFLFNMAPHKSDYLRLQIVDEMKYLGWHPYQILKSLKACHYQINQSTIWRIMNLYDKTGLVAYLPNSGRSSTYDKFALMIIQETLDENPVGCTARRDTAHPFVGKTLHYIWNQDR
uniref:Transposase n=1 Tax=Romanomermis culicivorax TaxID=13658 RepID=A0A915HR64_ROMCU